MRFEPPLDFHRARLADPDAPLSIKDFEGCPRPGYWAIRAEPKSKTWLPVLITEDAEVLVCGKPATDPDMIWRSAVKTPISVEEYVDMMEDYQ